MHAGWHWLSCGQHEGVAPEQSAFEVHVTHVPCSQYFAAAGQSEFARQSTHPSVGSQSCLLQVFDPLIPQRALPPPGPPLAPGALELLLPQATMTASRDEKANADP